MEITNKIVNKGIELSLIYKPEMVLDKEVQKEVYRIQKRKEKYNETIMEEENYIHSIKNSIVPLLRVQDKDQQIDIELSKDVLHVLQNFLNSNLSYASHYKTDIDSYLELTDEEKEEIEKDIEPEQDIPANPDVIA